MRRTTPAENQLVIDRPIEGELYLCLAAELEKLQNRFGTDPEVKLALDRFNTFFQKNVSLRILHRALGLTLDLNSENFNPDFLLAVESVKQKINPLLKDLVVRRQTKLRSARNWEAVEFDTQALNSGITMGPNDVHTAMVNFDNQTGEAIDPDFFVRNEVFKNQTIVLRIHSECFYGDVFDSQLCDCGTQLRTTKDLIEDRNMGIILYLKQEGRGVGLKKKNEALLLTQNQGLSADEAMIRVAGSRDLRSYDFVCGMLRGMSIDETTKILLVTDNMVKFNTLFRAGFDVELVTALGECESLQVAIEIVEKVVYGGYHQSLLKNSGALDWIHQEVQKMLNEELPHLQFKSFLEKLKLDFYYLENSLVNDCLAPVFYTKSKTAFPAQSAIDMVPQL